MWWRWQCNIMWAKLSFCNSETNKKMFLNKIKIFEVWVKICNKHFRKGQKKISVVYDYEAIYLSDTIELQAVTTSARRVLGESYLRKGLRSASLLLHWRSTHTFLVQWFRLLRWGGRLSRILKSVGVYWLVTVDENDDFCDESPSVVYCVL